tara:strand:+ start:4423 stop:5301 length:879 start_codon:yes stop_codon:yes gene_type:complete
MSNRDLLVDFLNYTREQNNIYDLIVKSITDSHQQTYHMLNTYLTDNNNESRVSSQPEATPTIRESMLRASNNIIDGSLNGTATLEDISTLISVLRENINILGGRNLNPNNTSRTRMTPGPSNAENSILQSVVTPGVTFSMEPTHGQSIGGLFHRITHDNRTPLRATPPTEEIDYRQRSSAIRHAVPRRRIFFEGTESLIVPGNLNSPVRVRPSIAQIRNGTRLVTFSRDISTNEQTQCPIDLNVFVDGDSILKILGCGHIFREMNLRQHFRHKATCPLCRYDIRDYNANGTQ